MASSVVELVNNALVELGQVNLIASLTEATRPAILANQKYPAIRDAVIRAFPWNCAITRRAMAPLGASPVYGWAYQFQLPSDSVRVLGLELLDDEWDVEGKTIVSNSNAINVKYLKRIEDVTQFDALLAEAISSRLAHALSYGLTQSASMREAMWENYKAKLREARTVDSQEGMYRTMEASEWLESRFSTGRVKDLRKPT